MSNSQTKTSLIEKSGRGGRVLLLVVAVIFFVITIPVAIVFFGELQREKLLRAYALVAASINLPNQPGFWPATLILQPNETIVCGMGSYGRVENLPALDANQRMSLPKSEIPSEDGSWYLLTFSERRVERIALYPGTTSNIVFADESCSDRASHFSISPLPFGEGERELAISFLSK